MDAPAKPNAQAQADASSAILMLVASALVIGVFYLQRVPQETILRKLEAKPLAFVQLAGLLVLPVLLFGFFDWLKVRQRDYVAPSLRVQISRSLAYGLLLLLANLAFFIWVRPSLLRTFVGLGSSFFFALLLTVPYGLGCWFLLFRRRQFEVEALPTFKEAALALRNTYDFLLGRTGSDWKTGGGDPRWYILPEKALYANVYCLGGIGSGKTSSVVKPLVEQALFKFPKEPKKKVAIFMLDAKGNNAIYMQERAKAAGREKDVIIIRPGGDYSYNPLGGGNPTAVAAKLVAALEVMTAQESHSFYKKMQLEYATNALGVLMDVYGQGKVSMQHLYDFVCDQAYYKAMLDQAKPLNGVGYRWFVNQWNTTDPREQKQLTQGFRADLNPFVQSDMAPTFAPANPTFPGWEHLIDEGKIVVFSMSLDEYGSFARAMGIFVLLDFQNVMLARTTTKFREAGHNTERLCLCVLDEVWAYLNEKLPEFTAVSREARCCTLALHQSLGQILKEPMRQVMLGNFRTPIILAINDPLSLKTFETMFGVHKVQRESRSESAGYAGVQKQLLSDSLVGKAGGESRSVSVSLSTVDEPRFPMDAILRLGKNRAIVQSYDGDVTSLPCVVETLPGYLAENQLG